jgi:hypothetical protein
MLFLCVQKYPVATLHSNQVVVLIYTRDIVCQFVVLHVKKRIGEDAQKIWTNGKRAFILEKRCIVLFQGVYFCMRDNSTELKWDGPPHPRSLILIPVYAYDDPSSHRRRPPVQQPSWWECCVAWLRYHSIQFRWDIERSFAQLLRRQ